MDDFIVRRALPLSRTLRTIILNGNYSMRFLVSKQCRQSTQNIDPEVRKEDPCACFNGEESVGWLWGGEDGGSCFLAATSQYQAEFRKLSMQPKYCFKKEPLQWEFCVFINPPNAGKQEHYLLREVRRYVSSTFPNTFQAFSPHTRGLPRDYRP